MSERTVNEIKHLLQTVIDEHDPFLLACEKDKRKSVQKLVEQWLKNKEKEKALKEHWQSINTFEKEAKSKGYQLIAGIDEVGRGPLAGPVVAAAVILKENCEILGLTDSKKLSEKKREEYYARIMEEAVAVGIGIIDAPIIDKINIYEASKQAMVQAIENLAIKPDFLLIDAMTLPVPTKQLSLIKGDSKSASIAASACIAKVTRDRLMSEYAKSYPVYGFENHKGYGTKEHIEAITKHGPTDIHRRSFAPVQSNS